MNSPQNEHELETQILRSWHRNASPWSRAIRSASIVSRELVTNAAIVDAVASICMPGNNRSRLFAITSARSTNVRDVPTRR